MVNSKSKNINNENYSNYIINNSIVIENINIENIDLNFCEIHLPVYIKKCIINNIGLNSSWFRNGFVLENSIILNDINYEMGGHNYSIIHIHNNIFCGFFDFFDCHFFEKMIVDHNIFLKGTNLLGNNNKGYKNVFDNGLELYENIGELDKEN